MWCSDVLGKAKMRSMRTYEEAVVLAIAYILDITRIDRSALNLKMVPHTSP